MDNRGICAVCDAFIVDPTNLQQPLLPFNRDLHSLAFNRYRPYLPLDSCVARSVSAAVIRFIGEILIIHTFCAVDGEEVTALPRAVSLRCRRPPIPANDKLRPGF
jgi:hypothetical protein